MPKIMPFDGLFTLDGLIHCVDIGQKRFCGEDDRSFDCQAKRDAASSKLLQHIGDRGEQEAPNALSSLADILGGNLASPDEIAHGFVRLVRNPNCRSFGARQARQYDRVAPISLNVIAGAPRGMSRRDDLADVAGGIDLPIQSVTTWSSFVDDVQSPGLIAELLQHGSDGLGRIADFAEKANVARPTSVRDGNRYRIFVNIKPEIGAKVHLGPSPCA